MILKTWGRSYNPLVTKRVKDPKCPDCDWDLLDNKTRQQVREKAQAVVGFSLNSPVASANDLSVGIVIIECQKCSCLFWFHVTEKYVEVSAPICDKWPKE